jgi:hypothetical protein
MNDWSIQEIRTYFPKDKHSVRFPYFGYQRKYPHQSMT